LFDLAARQFGCFTVQQAIERGLTRHRVAYGVRTGRFETVGRRVRRIAGTPPSWHQALAAGLLDLAPAALVSHAAAAALHGFDGFAPGPVEFVLPRRRHGVRGLWVVHTAVALERIDRTEVAGVACTSASRTVLDLARSHGPDELARAIDSAVRDGWSSPSFLRSRLGALRGPGHWGVRLLDELLVDAGGHSPLERTFLALVRRAGLPRPTCQRIFRADGTTIARVDFLFEPRPVVVEVTGRKGHVSDRERAKDARRRNELQALGQVVLEFTTDQVENQPGYVLATLRRQLG